ncbi:MAG: hypothetical protein C0190_01085 [Thermodesulfobacterium geofontis]|uniref:DUF4911 domain-containing protein n=1 Tax=Thermodesulfobacterium geofontis TaxID=1295609 RepID=A0A2N7PQ55_9BACT|nr:MAG: hypothetical protein C0190_01085 [Thermodesulfobacterium geofontis]
MRSSFFLIKLSSKKLAYLKFILEGYDHLAILSVLDPKKGLAKLHFFKNEKSFVKEILEDLKTELSLEIIDIS